MSGITKKMKADYLLNRVDMLKVMKGHRARLGHISLNGLSTDEDDRIAQIACGILVAEFLFEESVMADKIGEDGITL